MGSTASVFAKVIPLKLIFATRCVREAPCTEIKRPVRGAYTPAVAMFSPLE